MLFCSSFTDCISCWQALIFNKGRPHRSAIWTNWSLLASLLAQFIFLMYTLFAVDPFNLKVQELVGKDGVVGDGFRAALLAIMLANALAAVAVEALCRACLAAFARWRRRHGRIASGQLGVWRQSSF